MLEKKASSQGQKGRVFLVRRRSWKVFWQIGVFRLLFAVGICFFLLTGIAMLLYPGGTMTDPHRHGYAFFSNFLSDLGRTSTPSGQDNLASRLLFTIALNMGALGITLFFAAFTQFFPVPGTARWLSRLGAVSALITSLYFIGIAFVPLNRNGQLHNLFLYTASLSALLLAGSLLVFIFALLFGPAPGTPAWEIIHATGQKIIVAASILIGLIQALLVQPLPRKNAELPSN
ncbi:MAG: hypothetical protein E6I80_03555 [Chloroflexi bacterium]|nr:MAG: hypothetical protein E6I80_03555 [Chloroflexota bacterium]